MFTDLPIIAYCRIVSGILDRRLYFPSRKNPLAGFVMKSAEILVAFSDLSYSVNDFLSYLQLGRDPRGFCGGFRFPLCFFCLLNTSVNMKWQSKIFRLI